MKSDYTHVVEKLFSCSLFGGVKLGLNNVLHLNDLLGSPEKKFKSILVAGTNGKGSVSLKIAKALELSGLRVGLYTSPHISSFRERIRLNSVLISEEKATLLLLKIFALLEEHKISATFFEILTVLAFCYFAEESIDVAVLEVGLGGRLDATNSVAPILSVITSISYDHTAILGSSLDAIAAEKGGIMRPGVPLVLGPKACITRLLQMAKELGTPVGVVKVSSSTFYDQENCEIARAALLELNNSFPVGSDAIDEGLTYRPECRFQILPFTGNSGNGIVILDVAHNPDGFQRLFEAVTLHYPSRSIRVLLGMSKDKEIEACLTTVKSFTSSIHVVQANHERAASVDSIGAAFKRVGVETIRAHSSLAQGVQEALKEAAANQEVLVVCGTFFMMQEVRYTLGIQEPRDSLELNERLGASSPK